MAVSREKKQKIVYGLSEIAETASAIVFVDFLGMKTGAMNALRKLAKSMNGNVQIVKKTLAARGFNRVLHEEIINRPGGIAAIWFKNQEALSAFKSVWNFSKTHDAIKILGGYSAEFGIMSAQDVIAIAKLPPRDTLLAQLAWLLNHPMRSLVLVLDAIKRSK